MVLFVTIVILLLLILLIPLYVSLICKPNNIRKILRLQGIDGPPPKFLLGNILDVVRSQDASFVIPFFERWRKQYGPIYIFALGKLQMVSVNGPELLKEITRSTSLDWGRPSMQQNELGPLLGQGLLSSNGSNWARQRKIMAPEFHMDKVKGMMSIIIESAVTIIDSWRDQVDEGGSVDISVCAYMKRYSGEIISKSCLGSSYSEGQHIFSNIQTLQQLLSKNIFSALGVPGLRYLPTRTNKQIWYLEKQIGESILKIVKEKQQDVHLQNLLQMLLQGAKNDNLSSDAGDQFVVDNCKNMYLAGLMTTSTAASWCLMLLASHPEWQNRVRDEVKKVCQGRTPDINMLREMKELNMVIQETLRLYPSVPILVREALNDIKIGDVKVPKGANLWIMIATVHRDPDIWGPDALEFKPRRFENGTAGACKFPSSYMPFGFGQRICIGQNLTMVELKVIMSLILTNFSFTLSPSYVHAPVVNMIMEPKHGVTILVKKL